MNCEPINGVCTSCLRPMPRKFPDAKRMCRGTSTPAIVSELQMQSGTVLVGDVIAELTKAIGIPPCDGCEKRRQWLNKAHQWVRDHFSPKS